jgi:hypothetical protein
MVKPRVIIIALVSQLSVSAVAAPLQFSFAAPPGWQLDAARGADATYLLDPQHTYVMHPVRRPQPRCRVELRAESASTPAAAQSLKAMRTRSGVLDAREDEIHRSELVAESGIRIAKADYSTSYSYSARKTPLPIHSVLYSFRGPDGRVYTVHCSPSPGSRDEFGSVWDALARSIRFSP